MSAARSSPGSMPSSTSSSALFGTRDYTSFSRALGELKARRPITINAPGEELFLLPVEGLNDERLADFLSLCRPGVPDLIITQQRALALGLDATAPMAVRLPEDLNAGEITDLVAERKSDTDTMVRAA